MFDIKRDIKRGDCSSPEGLWLVNKPIGQSSFKSVAQMRRLSNIRKVGHTGTLDPLAEGLLVLLVGKAYTKQAQTISKLDKEYRLEITLGTFSETDDDEGEKTKISDRRPKNIEIEDAINGLSGEIMQQPPIYSAVKIAGKRAYQLARKGEKPDLKARSVQVYWWKDVSYKYPKIGATVRVSSGTYIRSLARSLGEELQTGAYLSALRRTRVGEFSIDDAVSLEKLLKS